MTFIRTFIKKEPVFLIALLAAAVSCFFVPPDKAYLAYIDFRTLALLYALMVVVAGFGKAGVFTALANTLCQKADNTRWVGIILVALCFFSSMVITNDVALLTFVPFTVVVLDITGRKKDRIPIIVLQTVAANLGSMLTPVGNPQNLYLYSCYNMSFGQFLSVTFPVWVLSLALILGACFLLLKSHDCVFTGEAAAVDKRSLFVCLVLFIVCLLTVVRVLKWPEMLCIVILGLLIHDRSLLSKADFMLLLTFVAFFVFAGNLARIDAVSKLLKTLLLGREYAVSLLASQVISNVPAALLLSGFTSNAKALLLGVNVGGLGTPIASLASLISLKLYSRGEGARTGRYLAVFTAVNVILLVLLTVFAAVTG